MSQGSLCVAAMNLPPGNRNAPDAPDGRSSRERWTPMECASLTAAPPGVMPSAWTRKRGLRLRPHGSPVCATIALCLPPKHLGASPPIHSPKYGSQLDKRMINVWFIPNFLGAACGQFPFPPFAQGVDSIYPGSTLALTVARRENPQLFRPCAQARCRSAQVIHRLVHRMAVQPVSSSTAKRRQICPPTECPARVKTSPKATPCVPAAILTCLPAGCARRPAKTCG
jgi:hypothetical protein